MRAIGGKDTGVCQVAEHKISEIKTGEKCKFPPRASVTHLHGDCSIIIAEITFLFVCGRNQRIN